MPYFKVEVPAPDVTADMFTNRRIEQYAWCEDNLSRPNYNLDPDNYWYGLTGYGKMKFWFRNEQHALMFTLRWA